MKIKGEYPGDVFRRKFHKAGIGKSGMLKREDWEGCSCSEAEGTHFHCENCDCILNEIDSADVCISCETRLAKEELEDWPEYNAPTDHVINEAIAEGIELTEPRTIESAFDIINLSRAELSALMATTVQPTCVNIPEDLIRYIPSYVLDRVRFVNCDEPVCDITGLPLHPRPWRPETCSLCGTPYRESGSLNDLI